MKKIIATSIFGQFGQNLYQNMRKDCKNAQRPQAAFGRPKDPVAASGRLKILYDYILNNSKILLDTIWISYSKCDKQKILEKVFFLKYPSRAVAYPSCHLSYARPPCRQHLLLIIIYVSENLTNVQPFFMKRKINIAVHCTLGRPWAAQKILGQPLVA